MAVQEQLDMDLMAEAELARLQRQYRIMEGDRIAFAEETSKKLSKQRKLIAILKKEHKELQEDLRVANSDSQRKKDIQVSNRLNKLMDTYDKVVDEAKAHKKELCEVDHQVKKLEKLVSRLRSKEITDNEFRDRVQSGKKTVETLENRLETVVRRFCTVLTENKNMREEIDHLLKERANFNVTWEKLLQDLNTGKRTILDLIEQATIAYDQREEWCSKLQALRMRAQNDLFLHTQDMREMQRCLDHDGKLKEFLSIKGQKRIMKDLEEKEQKKKELEQEDVEKQVKVFQEALQKIQELSGETAVDRIASQYLKEEEENFALFNYVNELNHELEILNETIEQVEARIQEQKESNLLKAREQKHTIDGLRAELEAAIREVNEAEKEVNQTDEEMKTIMKGIENIFVLLKCEEAPILDLISGAKGAKVNNSNVMVYLGLINKKISDLITTLYFKEKSMCKQRKSKKEDKEEKI